MEQSVKWSEEVEEVVMEEEEQSGSATSGLWLEFRFYKHIGESMLLNSIGVLMILFALLLMKSCFLHFFLPDIIFKHILRF